MAESALITCPCGCGAQMVNGQPIADHPHINPGDKRVECWTCGKWVHLVIHSCKGVPVTVAARKRDALNLTRPTGG